jgi:thiol-disulfide isomerase/thioredoxin
MKLQDQTHAGAQYLRGNSGLAGMARIISGLLFACIATTLLIAGARVLTPLALAAGQATATNALAPEFPHTRESSWLNSPPLTLASLRGKVVLLDIWTTDCWNCYRSFPWLRRVTDRFATRGLMVIGVHSPEFEHEKDRRGIATRLAQYQLTNPQLLDDDFAYWHLLDNQYWPAFYLIDKKGRMRQLLVGEQHSGDRSARNFEAEIETLLNEPLGQRN